MQASARRQRKAATGELRIGDYGQGRSCRVVHGTPVERVGRTIITKFSAQVQIALEAFSTYNTDHVLSAPFFRGLLSGQRVPEGQFW